VVSGPTTIAALLNSLRLGFRSLAIEQQASEVWQVLGAVKTEFGKFGDVLSKVKKQLAAASNTIEKTEQRTRVMASKLREVEQLPSGESDELLELLSEEEEVEKD
jgi:DNA recombination protein RmuC